MLKYLCWIENVPEALDVFNFPIILKLFQDVSPVQKRIAIEVKNSLDLNCK